MNTDSKSGTEIRMLPIHQRKKEAWLKKFATNILSVADKYGISTLHAIEIISSTEYYLRWYELTQQLEAAHKKARAYRTLLCEGFTEETEKPGAAAPQLTTPQLIQAQKVRPGLFKRALAMAHSIVSHPCFNREDALLLGIETNNSNFPEEDFDNYRPKIKLVKTKEGHPQITWDKMDLEGVDIFVNRKGTFQLLARATSGTVVDNAQIPEDTIETWEYKAIYRHHGKEVGLWSDVKTIKVNNHF